MPINDDRKSSVEYLRAFNEGERQDLSLWEAYHTAALAEDASRSSKVAQNDWQQALRDGNQEKLYPALTFSR